MWYQYWSKLWYPKRSWMQLYTLVLPMRMGLLFATTVIYFEIEQEWYFLSFEESTISWKKMDTTKSNVRCPDFKNRIFQNIWKQERCFQCVLYKWNKLMKENPDNCIFLHYCDNIATTFSVQEYLFITTVTESTFFLGQ